MSTDAATADRWVADLEDILGLSPAGRQKSGAESKSLDKPAPSRSIYFAAAGIGLAMFVVAVGYTDLSAIIGMRNPNTERSAPTDPRRAGLDRSGVSAGIDAVRSSNTGRDAEPGATSLTQADATPPISGLETFGTTRREVRPMSFRARSETPRRGNDVDAGGREVASITARELGRKIVVTPDLAGPPPDPAQGISPPDVKPAGGEASLASIPLALLRQSGMGDGVEGRRDGMSSDKAGMTPARADPEKTIRKKTEAVDALRMLRRQ